MVCECVVLAHQCEFGSRQCELGLFVVDCLVLSWRDSLQHGCSWPDMRSLGIPFLSQCWCSCVVVPRWPCLYDALRRYFAFGALAELVCRVHTVMCLLTHFVCSNVSCAMLQRGAYMGYDQHCRPV